MPRRYGLTPRGRQLARLPVKERNVLVDRLAPNKTATYDELILEFGRQRLRELLNKSRGLIEEVEALDGSLR